ncbi:lipopolysaccharide biosynthesis protein [Massilia eurypsychrophila]|nr:lipopolysaccharide biosynthesis protein [Massilia eurypsychrophila]
MSGVRRALAFSIGERYVMLVIALASNMAIARLLTPEAIGIYSVSMAIVGVAQVLRDFGVASYLIQEKDLKDEYIQAAFGILLVLGVGVAIVLLFAAPYIGALYGEPRMIPTLRVCALNFLLIPFCTVSLAILRRNMQFKRLAAVNLAATAAGAIATTGLAFLGYGVISLAIGSVLLNAVTGIGAWIVREDRRILMPAFAEWRRVINFGAQSSVSGIVTSLAMDTNDLVVGKLMGFGPVAILSRAQGLMNLFHRDMMAAIRNVAYPAYAQAHRDNQALEPVYITSVTNVTAVAWPFYGFLALYSHEILRLMFGPQWDAAAPLVPIFCLAGAIAAISSLASSVILAVRRIDLVTKVELSFQPLRAAMIVAAALIFQTTMACALALAISLLIQLPMVYYAKGRCIANDYRALFFGLGQSAKVTLACLIVPSVIAFYTRGSRDTAIGWFAFACAALVCVACWAAALVAVRHPLASEPIFQKMRNAGRLRKTTGT